MTRRKRAFLAIIGAQRYAQRSNCWVMAGAVITNKNGEIITGGWNHAGPNGMGMHAEAEAIRRLRRRHAPHAITIAKFNGKKWLKSPPCSKCAALIALTDIKLIRYFNGKEWKLDGQAH